MNIEELIRWLEAFEVDGHYGTWVPDEIREAAQALRKQQAEIERQWQQIERLHKQIADQDVEIEELKDQVETWECDNYNRQMER